MSGKLVHFELPVQDVDRGKRFWGGVFGWEFGDSAMPDLQYFMVRTGEDQGGAILASEHRVTAPIVYFDTDDIDASIAKVKELGGKTEEKMPIPHVGWFTHCEDPGGIAFSLFQSDESVTG
jgi:predicted enzyme related to lactoylglutathione lyase